jgi:hypothetical protein
MGEVYETNCQAELRKTADNEDPLLQVPLRAGGTARARGLVPLAKRGEPQGGGLIWRWVWMLVVVSCWLQATAQPAELSQDPPLQRRITVWLKMEPLRDALRTIGKQTGVALRCQDAIAEEKVAIFVRDRPAHEMLTQLAGALALCVAQGRGCVCALCARRDAPSRGESGACD